MGRRLCMGRGLVLASVLFSFGGLASTAVAAESDEAIFTYVETEQLEYRVQDGGDQFAWEPVLKSRPRRIGWSNASKYPTSTRARLTACAGAGKPGARGTPSTWTY